MQCLFFDLASHDALVACTDDQRVLAHASVSARIADHELLPLVEQVCSDADVPLVKLDRLACVIGPGGFTSLRVAVACVNTLADQLAIPVAGIHLSALYRARITDGANDTYWLHSTKKDQIFIHGGLWEEPTLIPCDDCPSSTQWCGELIDEHRTLVDTDPVSLLPVLEVLPTLLTSLDYQQKPLAPWYGRGW